MVGDLFERAAAGGVALKVHHGADGARLHLHQHQATAVNVGQRIDLRTEGPVGQFLNVDVDGGAKVESVDCLYVAAVEVAHAAVVGHAQALAAVFAVKNGVEAALKAYVGVGHGR